MQNVDLLFLNISILLYTIIINHYTYIRYIIITINDVIIYCVIFKQISHVLDIRTYTNLLISNYVYIYSECSTDPYTLYYVVNIQYIQRVRNHIIRARTHFDTPM